MTRYARNIHKYAGGLDNTNPDSQIRIADFVTYDNVDMQSRYYVKQRLGTYPYSASDVGYELDSLYRHEPYTGTGYFLYTANGTMYYTDDTDGSWTSLQVGLTVGKEGAYTFFVNYLYYVSEDGLYKINTNGETPTISKITDFVYKGRSIVAFKNRLFITRDPDYPRRIYYTSNLRDDSTWDDYFDCDDEVQGLVPMQDYIYVILKSRVDYIVEDSEYLYSIRPTAIGVGAWAPNSIAKTKNGVLFLARDGVHYIAGVRSVKVSQKVDTELSPANLDSNKNACGIFVDDVYYLAYNSKSSPQSHNDAVLAGDFLTLQNIRWSRWTGIYPGRFTAKKSTPFYANLYSTANAIIEMNRGYQDIDYYGDPYA